KAAVGESRLSAKATSRNREVAEPAVPEPRAEEVGAIQLASGEGARCDITANARHSERAGEECGFMSPFLQRGAGQIRVRDPHVPQRLREVVAGEVMTKLAEAGFLERQ